VIAIIAILAAILFPVFARAREAARKATCISNVKQLTLACLMYAGDYDEVLPSAVSSSDEGMAHAVHPALIGTLTFMRANIGAGTRRQTWQDANFATIRSTYGEGFTHWQLADLIIQYVKSDDLFQCPTLVRRGRGAIVRYQFAGPYADPIQAAFAGLNKVASSGSYDYACMHHPRYYPSFVWGSGWMGIWDYAHVLGIGGQKMLPALPLATLTNPAGWPLSQDGDPQKRLACMNSLSVFDNPVWEPLVLCDSFGMHEGYSSDYTDDHVLPVSLGGVAPTMQAATPVGFVDGHAKYNRMGFYQMLALIVQLNETGGEE
jgi:hypothetical protein